MNVNSGGPHILLFERDQQLTTLLSVELAQAGYEVHTSRTAVEVFDAIARFPVRLVMVNMAQAQAGRREFWVALDAQRRGRGVQVFTFRCANLGGYGPDDPEEHVETVMTEMEVEGTYGLTKLVDAVRGRVPGSTTISAPARSMYEPIHEQVSVRPMEIPTSASPLSMPIPGGQPLQNAPRQYPTQETLVPPPPARTVEQQPTRHSTFTDKIRAVIYPGGRNVSSSLETPRAPQNSAAPAQYIPAQYQNPESQPQYNQRSAEMDRERTNYNTNREETSYQAPANYNPGREAINYQVPVSPPIPDQQTYPTTHNVSAERSGTYVSNEESGLDQLSRMLRDSQPTPQNTIINGNIQTVASQIPGGLNIDPQEIQDFRAQILQAARLDEAYQHSNPPQMRQPDTSSLGPQLRASPIQDIPFEREMDNRRGTMNSAPLDNSARPAMTILQPTQYMPPVQQGQQPVAAPQNYQQSGQIPVQQNYQQPVQAPTPQNYQQASAQQNYQQATQVPEQQSYQQVAQTSPAQQNYSASNQATGQISPVQQNYQPSTPQNYQQPVQASSVQQNYQPPTQSAMTQQQYEAFSTGNSAQVRAVLPPTPPETPLATTGNSQPLSMSETQALESGVHISGKLHLDEDPTLAEQVQASLQQTLARRPEFRTSDDMLLDIVKSLPPMTPAPQPPQPQVLTGRATRSLGSVLLEGHLVPQERLQVAQHVQRMLRGVDLNYQLGEILLMFKLLTPDQLLAASLVSYGMISTIQISGLGRIRQELHAMGLEYDLESLVVLFRILTPEQLREVRASWSS